LYSVLAENFGCVFLKKIEEIGFRVRQEFTLDSHVARIKWFKLHHLFAVVEKLKGCFRVFD